MSLSREYAVSASLMCADLMNVKRDLESLEKGEIEFLHCDVMDGHFVENITLGIDFCVAVSNHTSIKRDIHFLANDPLKFIDRLQLKKNELVSVHFESNADLSKISHKVRSYGAKFGVALNPETKVEDLMNQLCYVDFVVLMMIKPGFAGQPIIPGIIQKIKTCRDMLNETPFKDILIEVDGHVGFDNMKKMKANGASIFVCGTSSIFNKNNTIVENIKMVRSVLK